MVWSVLGLVAIGVVLGTGIGALAGYGTYQPCNDNDYGCFDLGRGFDVGLGAVVGGLVGAFAVPILWMLWRLARRFTHLWPRRVSDGSTANPRGHS